MKKFILLLAAMLTMLMLSSCKSSGASEPEDIIRDYFSQLQKGVFAEKYWDLEKLCRFYYWEYMQKADKAEIDRLIAVIQKFSVSIAKQNQNMAFNSRLENLNLLEKTPDRQKIRAHFVSATNSAVYLDIDFVFEKNTNGWKIVNYEKMAYPGDELELISLFRIKIYDQLKAAGYPIDNITLPLINKYLEEKYAKSFK